MENLGIITHSPKKLNYIVYIPSLIPTSNEVSFHLNNTYIG